MKNDNMVANDFVASINAEMSTIKVKSRIQNVHRIFIPDYDFYELMNVAMCGDDDTEDTDVITLHPGMIVNHIWNEEDGYGFYYMDVNNTELYLLYDNTGHLDDMMYEWE